MYGIPGYVPTIREPRPRGKRVSNASEVYPPADATEELLDSALAATFPASDPLSITQPGACSPPADERRLNNDDSQRRSPDAA